MDSERESILDAQPFVGFSLSHRCDMQAFIEVKTRSNLAFGHPLEAVDAEKQRRIRRTAAAWLRANRARPTSLRFDVVAIVGAKIQVVENAF